MKSTDVNGIEANHAAAETPRKLGDAAANGNSLEEVRAKKDQKKPPSKASVRVAVCAIFAALVLVLLGPTLLRRPKPATAPFSANDKGARRTGPSEPSADATSRTPIIDARRTPEKPVDQNPVDADQIAHTATVPPTEATPGTLGAITPFGKPGGWTPPPYSGTSAEAGETTGNTTPTDTRSEHDAMDKASLVFVKSSPAATGSKAQDSAPVIDFGIGLPPGTRLRARLESAVNTAVTTPVVAVIEYNYEHNGEIVIPAGARVFGHLEAADRSGYVGVRFDSLMMPDGASLTVEAVATDLQFGLLRGRVEGKNTGKNIVIRSLAGVGEIGAALVGRGSLNQPLSESDLLRERVSSNIGQASDQQLASLALTQRIVVTVPAGREIYVVLEKPAKEGAQNRSARPAQASNQPSVDELRQLLRLQREMNETPADATHR